MTVDGCGVGAEGEFQWHDCLVAGLTDDGRDGWMSKSLNYSLGGCHSGGYGGVWSVTVILLTF